MLSLAEDKYRMRVGDLLRVIRHLDSDSFVMIGAEEPPYAHATAISVLSAHDTEGEPYTTLYIKTSEG